MTFKVLTEDTQRVMIFRSQVRPADDPKRPNLRLTDLFDGEPPAQIFVRSKDDPTNPDQLPNIDNETGEIKHDVTPTMVPIDTSDLIGRTFLKDGPDGTRLRFRIAEQLDQFTSNHQQNQQLVRFKSNLRDNEKYEEIITYGEILQHLERDQDKPDILWRFKRPPETKQTRQLRSKGVGMDGSSRMGKWGDHMGTPQYYRS